MCARRASSMTRSLTDQCPLLCLSLRPCKTWNSPARSSAVDGTGEWRRHESSDAPRPPQEKNLLRKRGSSNRADASAPCGLRGYDVDPTCAFGVLVPPELRRASSHFRTALERLVHVANLETKIKACLERVEVVRRHAAPN